MVTQDDFRGFLEGLCGSSDPPFFLVKDEGSEIGWRPCTEDDTRAIFEWFTERVGEGSTNFDPLTCYNLKEVAAKLGVSIPKCQELLKRRDHPIPFIRDGRTIRVPALLLLEWMREETARTGQSNRPP